MSAAWVTACVGFLLGILWLDLIFDVQTARSGRLGGRAREDALAVVSTYYRHATGGLPAMSHVIAALMLATLASIVVQLVGDTTPDWVAWLSLVATGIPIARAGTNTVPCAMKLGAAATEERALLARRVLWDHVIAIIGLTLALLVQLTFGR